MKRSFEYLSKEHAEYIRQIVKKAGETDPQREVFGASKHQYELNPVLSIEEVEQYEREHGVVFPKEYVFFLTQIGNGGAGPAYGIWPLGEMGVCTKWFKTPGKASWINSTLSKEEWSRAVSDEECENDDWEEKTLAGTIAIGTRGCTFDTLLICTGMDSGKVVYLDWNLEEDYPPYIINMTFLEWYERYFCEIIEGYKLDSYGYLALGSEAELIGAYQKADTVQKKEYVLKGFYRCKKLKEETTEFLSNIEEKEMDGIRTHLLLLFDLKKGLQSFETLLKGRNQLAAIECSSVVPKECREKYYVQMLELLYDPKVPYKEGGGLSYRKLILFFMSDCSSFRAADVVAFAVDTAQAEDERRVAFIVMGRAVDRADYPQAWIVALKDGNSEMALEALMAMSRTKCPELIDTYCWMWERYKENHIMRSHLNIAFQTEGMEMEEK